MYIFLSVHTIQQNQSDKIIMVMSEIVRKSVHYKYKDVQKFHSKKRKEHNWLQLALKVSSNYVV